MNPEPCLCGAPDCRRCYPGNFRGKIYVGEMSDDEIDDMEAARDQQEEDRAEDRREAMRGGAL